MVAPENVPSSTDGAVGAQEDLQRAADPGTDPGRLVELAARGDGELCRAIAGNPNAPLELLCTLGADFPAEFLANPALLLLLLEEPNLAEKMPLATLRVLVRYEALPVAMLMGAARRGDFQIEQALTANPQTPASILETMARHGSPRVRTAAKLHVALAGELPATTDWRDRARQAAISTLQQGRADALLYPYVPLQLLEWLSTCEAPLLREAVAKNPVTPPKLLACLAADSVLQVRKAAAGNPTTPPATLAELGCDSRPELLAVLAANPQASDTLLAGLARATATTLQEKIATLEQTAGNRLDNLVRPEWAILAAIVQNPSASRPLLKELLATLEATVRRLRQQHRLPRIFLQQYSLWRWQLAMHPNIPEVLATELFGPDLLAQIGRCFESIAPVRPGIASFGILKQIAANPRAPRTVLAQLAQASLPLQAAIARNPNAPPELIRQWSRLPARQRSIAANPQTAAALVAEFARDRDPQVRRDVARNPALDPRTCGCLARDDDEGVRLDIATNPAIPTSVLEQLLADTSPRVRSAAIAPYLQRVPEGLPQVLASTLQARCDPHDLDRRFLLLFHPQMPPPCLVAHSRALNWLERCAIAQNPNTPLPCLERLAAEGNGVVRAAARANLQRL